MIDIGRREICITLRRAGWRKSRHAHRWTDPTGITYPTTNSAWKAFQATRGDTE